MASKCSPLSRFDCVTLNRCGRVAQLVEQRPFKAWVAGSNPAALTIDPRSGNSIRGPSPSAQDFACGLPLRSRPQDGSSSNPAALTIDPRSGNSIRGPSPSAQDFACGLPLRSRPQDGSSSNPAALTIDPRSGNSIRGPSPSAQDFACGLPLRSRPQDGSSSNPAALTIDPRSSNSIPKSTLCSPISKSYKILPSDPSVELNR